jgi:transcription initiation factor IIE alpha subunit
MSLRLQKLNNRLVAEKETQYYACCLRMDITTAMMYNFKCPECGQVMMPEDNNHKINAIQDDIKDIEEFIKTYS